MCTFIDIFENISRKVRLYLYLFEIMGNFKFLQKIYTNLFSFLEMPPKQGMEC